MTTVYVVAYPTPDAARPPTMDCYLKSDTGQMGFARDTALWAALVDGTWVYDRSTATFINGGAKALALVRKHMRPFSVALLPKSSESASWIQDLLGRQQRARVEATRARLKGETVPRNDQIFGSSVVDIPLIQAHLPPDCEAQIWRFGDRGEYCTLLSNAPFVRSRAAGVFVNRGISVVEVGSKSQVPAW